jgi:hypothetical protein
LREAHSGCPASGCGKRYHGSAFLVQISAFHGVKTPSE